MSPLAHALLCLSAGRYRGVDGESSIDVVDAMALIDWAERHYILPLAAEALNSGVSLIGEHAARHLKERLRHATMHSMQLRRLVQRLQLEFLQPKAIRHAFFKGVAVGSQLYGDVGRRHSLDVDVLVEAHRIGDVGHWLIGQGFQVTNPSWASFRGRDLRSFVACEATLELRSPLGEQVELHRLLDANGCIFDSDVALRRSLRTATDAGFRVLDFDMHVVYLCYHHTRHCWNSLHWCADLEAISRHPDFAAQRVLQLAGRLGLETTVAESLLFAQDLSALRSDASWPVDAARSRFLSDWLRELETQLSAMESAPADEPLPASRSESRDKGAFSSEPDFPYQWQSSPRYRRRVARRRWRPDANDVNALPLPWRMFWLYYLLRPVRIVLSRIGKLVRFTSVGSMITPSGSFGWI